MPWRRNRPFRPHGIRSPVLKRRATADEDERHASLRSFVFSGKVSGNRAAVRMTRKTKSSLATHRAQMRRRGFVRVEVKVRKEDAGLVRRVASALSDPSRQAEARRLLQQRFLEPPKVSLKTLLASAPLDGIDLERSPDPGREVDL
jgi:hypothetical protein